MSGITAVVASYNADWRLERCLESLTHCSEIVVVDMCSTNDTVARARRFTEHIHVRDGGGDIHANVNFGIAQARNEYIQLVPQDHVVPPELAAELKAIAESDSADAVEIEQRTFKFGREIKFGGADERWIRIFGRKSVMVLPEGALHRAPGFAANARVVRAKNALLHNSDVKISDWISKQNRFTDLDVGRLGFLHHDDLLQAFGPAKLTLRMARIFFNLYVKRRGYRDGVHGYLLAMFSAFYHLTEQAKGFEKGWDWSDVPAALKPPSNRA